MKKIDRIFCVSICDIISWMIILTDHFFIKQKQQPRNFNIEAVEITICIINLETVLSYIFHLFYYFILYTVPSPLNFLLIRIL